jgi:hypothetical protein
MVLRITLPAATDPRMIELMRDALSAFSNDPRVHEARERRWADREARGKRIDALLARATELLAAAGRTRSPARMDALIDTARAYTKMAGKLLRGGG